jgi:hypothetical protein
VTVRIVVLDPANQQVGKARPFSLSERISWLCRRRPAVFELIIFKIGVKKSRICASLSTECRGNENANNKKTITRLAQWNED